MQAYIFSVLLFLANIPNQEIKPPEYKAFSPPEYSKTYFQRRFIDPKKEFVIYYYDGNDDGYDDIAEVYRICRSGDKTIVKENPFLIIDLKSDEVYIDLNMDGIKENKIKIKDADKLNMPDCNADCE
ncbi:MAG TPA: hypothetical protein VJB11_00045 [archaeon]|nr:hypothetical protein [archaeon]